MSPELRAIFLGVAFVLFVVAAFVSYGRVNLLALGAASAIAPFAWDAFELATES